MDETKCSCEEVLEDVSEDTIEDLHDIHELIQAIQMIILSNSDLHDIIFRGDTLVFTSVVPESTECLQVSFNFVPNPDLRLS